MGFDFNITKPLHKVWCRVMLQRYLGKFLERNLALDQLSIDLVKGNIQIEDLSLNVNAVNEVLSTINVPLKLIDGYVGNISIAVPWTCLMAEATKMKITDLQLTFQPTGVFKLDEKEIINSMIESVVSSLVSSGDLARSIREEVQKDGNTDELDGEDSIDSFAKIIDAIYSRFCVEIEKITIRVEYPSMEDGVNLCTAFELRVETARFMDEQMRACVQNDSTADLITSQPHGIGSITNLNKSLTLDGVSVYTDVFSNITDVACGTEANVLITSMHIRREKMKQQSPCRSPDLSVHQDMYTSSMSDMTAFHSCYASMIHDTIPDPPSPTRLDPLRPAPTEPELFSNPIKILDVVGQATIVFRLQNAANNTQQSASDENRIDTEIFIKGVNMFACPSQISILKKFFSSLSVPNPNYERNNEKPMDREDYEAIMKTFEEFNSANGRQHQNQESQKKQKQHQHSNQKGYGGSSAPWQEPADEFMEFDSINLDDKRGRKSMDSAKDGYRSLKNSTIDREEMNLKATIGNLLLYVPHCDYLSVDYVQENGGYHRAINELQIESERFFQKADEVVFSTQVDLKGMRPSNDQLYLKDHLRIVGSSVIMNYVSKRIASSESMQAKFIVSHCDVLEYLTRESVPSSSTALRVPILDYADMENDENDPNLKLVMSSSTETKGQIHIGVFISPCKTELDLSMVDRIADLIVTSPFFDEKRESANRRKDILALKDDLFPTTATEETKKNQVITVVCKNWMVNLRIPIADLRDPTGSRHPFAQRHVHNEYLKICFKDVDVRIPQDNEELTRIDIGCTQITADFCGSDLDIPADQARFLYGVKNGLDKVRIKIEKDARTRRTPIVSRVSIPITCRRDGEADMSKSVYSPVFMFHPRKDGPFAKVPQSFNAEGMDESEEIIQAGSREEMLEFMEECINFTSFKLVFDVPNLRLHVPEKKHLEVLYNRLVNDLALFQPAAPALRAEDDKLKINALEAFHECPPPKNDDSDGSDIGEEEEVANHSVSEPEEFDRYVPHTFATAFNVRKCMILCNTVVRENAIEKGAGQVALEMDNVNMGATVGYHGDNNHTYFHFTAEQTAVGSTNDPKRFFPRRIEMKDFGKWGKEDRQVEYVSKTDEFSSEMTGDSLAVALHMHSRLDVNIKDVLLCIAFRNSLLQVKPLTDFGQLWLTQLSELFTLQDYAIPGYELPRVTTDLHITLDNAIADYDHSTINPTSKLKLRAVFGLVNISSSFLEELNLSKTLCLLERSTLYISNGELKETTTKYNSSGKERKQSQYVPVLNIGLIHFYAMISAETDMAKRQTPVFELNFQNDCIMVDVCSDSLATLTTLIFEITSSEKFSQKNQDDGDDKSETSEVAGSVRKSSRNDSGDTEMPPEIAKRLMDDIEDAMREVDSEVAFGKDAVEEFRNDFKPKTSFNNFDEVDYNPYKPYKCAGDDEFCMVDEDILGSGITNVPGEARVRFVGTSSDGFVKIKSDHFAQSSEWKTDGYTHHAGEQPLPLIKYHFKDVSIRFSIYAGNDLQSKASPSKSYCTEEYKNDRNADDYRRGGQHRDHSACIILDLRKITYLKEIFDKSSPHLASTLFSIDDIVIKDRVRASDIEEMLYQYSTSEQPCRKNAAIISFRMSETHTREGKLRVSMLPIKINVDQDTLEFISEFLDETKKAIKLPQSFTNSHGPHYRPIIEVPAEVRDRRASRKGSKSSCSSGSSAALYPNLQKPSLSMEPLTPTPVLPPAQLGDLSYLENRNNVPISPLKFPIVDAPLTASAVSIGDMFSPSSASKSSPFNISYTNSSSDKTGNDTFNSYDMQGDWHNECNSNFMNANTMINDNSSPDDILCRSTMMGSIHPTMVNDLIDTSSDHEEHGNFLDGIEEDDSGEETDREPSGSGFYTNAPPEEELQRQEIFFKEFVFSPAVNIYVDYQGKRKISVEKTGAMVGLLMAFGQLNQMPINLREINNSSGLLGVGSCFKFAIDEWSVDLLNSMPTVIASYGPISPFVQIGKGFFDLIWMPVAEMRKENGRVVKGIQNGVGSFGMSSAAGIVGMAQTFTGIVQSIAEMTMREMKPCDAHLGQRNRRPSRVQAVNPTDVRHSLQLAYGILYDGYHQTKDDLELAAQEDRASGGSVVRSAFRYAVPTFLGPIVMATQVTYQLLGGLRNQLRPDVYRDERRKWGEKNVPGGIGKR